MHIRTVLIWVIVAGILGAVVVLTRPTNDPVKMDPTDSWRSLGIDPARVVRVTRIVEGQPDQIVERSGAGGQDWSVLWGPTAQRQSWPADPRRIRAGNRSLGTQRIAESDEDTLREIAGTVLVEDADGQKIEIAIGRTPVGGFLPVRIDERNASGIVESRWFGRITTEVRDAFITTGFLPWRSNSIFTSAPSQIHKLALAAGQHQVALERQTNGWSITAPFRTNASDPQCNDLIGALLGLESVGFVDGVDEQIMTGFETPIAIVSMETPNGSVTMRIGAQADMGGTEVFAHIQTPEGNAVVRLLKENLAKLTPTPEAYIDRVPVSISASDISRITIQGKNGRTKLDATRTLGAWTINGSPATVQYEDAINRLIRVMSVEESAGSRFINADQIPPDTMGSIKGFDREGRTIFDLGFGLDSSDAGLQLLLLDGLGEDTHIMWICTSDEAGGSGAWLTATVSRLTP